MTVLPTAEREAIERWISSESRRAMRTVPSELLGETERDRLQAAWMAARDFYGPERVAELERERDSAQNLAKENRADVEAMGRRLRDAEGQARLFRGAIEKAKKAAPELGEALWRLDRIVEAVLLADCAGAPLPLHRLDEIRGEIWATYNGASTYLKARLAADENPEQEHSAEPDTREATSADDLRDAIG